VLKTSGLVDQLRAALAIRAPDIRAAFVYGSIARGEDTSSSDVDLLVISDHLAYADLFVLLDPASIALARAINPTLYSGDELRMRREKGNHFLTRVLQQPKLWVIGSDDDLGS
jgi:predicted nucleotidyltransferase